MEGKVSAMLASTKANKKTMEKLHYILEKYMDKGKRGDDGSMSLPIDIMESPTFTARQHSKGG